ncbi:MAG: ribosome small subunit-dependent GTPase A [Firmicutes bacterium]|nr:ribosome small subunit-dependent GTPase A [Bacillota bacterium]
MASELGIVLRGVGGIYDVETSGGKVIRCRPRGRIKQSLAILAGDRVRYLPLSENEGVIEEVLPRTTVIYRPAVANVDQLIVVSACARPDPQLMLIDKLLVLAESRGLRPVVCLNKVDLVPESVPEELTAIYERAGYLVLRCSAKFGVGIDQLRRCLEGKTSSFAGPSGAGKSSLLNAVQPGLRLTTGKVSRKTGRGRQTTRQVALLPLECGGYVADTPGFSQLRLDDLDGVELDSYFPELRKHKVNCRFTSCLHRSEPDCGVKEALADGRIAPSRYENYLLLLDELEQQARTRY